jgi:hypothetical protein
MLKISIALIVLSFIVTSLGLLKPISDGGKLSLKLLLINALGWLLILPFPNDGHPPPALIALIFFWLLNCLVLPAATAALWTGYRKNEESNRFLALATIYLCLNFVLFLIPIAWLILGATRGD